MAQEQRTKVIQVTDLYFKYVLNATHDVVVQVGGRFSGKSHNEQIRLTQNVATKTDYKLLIVEDLETGMSEGFHSGIYDRIRDFEHTPAYSPQTKVAHVRNLINNNSVIFRGYATDQQKLNVKKLSGITEILVEEGEWMCWDDLMSLLQQLRGGYKKDRKLTILMNPVNPNCFVNEYLIEATPNKVYEYFPDEPTRPKVFEKNIKTKFNLFGKEVEKTIKILVVLSTHFDNSFLTLEQRASIEQYRDTDPEKYEQLGRARFIRPSGTYFKEFKREHHVIEPFEIPLEWNCYFVLDYGLDMLAGYWIALDFQDNAYVYRELYQNDLIVSDAGKMIKEYEGNDKIKLRYAPPDLYNRNRDTGKSTIELLGEQKLFFIKSQNNRVQGWYNLKEWLKVREVKCEQTGIMRKKPRLQFFSTCYNVIRTLPQLLRDEKNPNDVDPKINHEWTHGPDAIRYFFADRPIASTTAPKQTAEEEDTDYIQDSRSFYDY